MNEKRSRIARLQRFNEKLDRQAGKLDRQAKKLRLAWDYARSLVTDDERNIDSCVPHDDEHFSIKARVF